MNDSEINIEKDKELTKKLIIQYPFSVFGMLCSYLILLGINEYFNLSDNTLFKIITYMVIGSFCFRIFPGLISVFISLPTFAIGVYSRIFKTEYYGLVNRFSILNELMNVGFLGASVYVIWLILQLTNVVSTSEYVFNSIKIFNSADSIATINKKKVIPAYGIGELTLYDIYEITKVYEKALHYARKANIDEMNKHYEGFGDIYSKHFIKGLELWIQKFHSNDSSKISYEAQRHLFDFKLWYDRNHYMISSK